MLGWMLFKIGSRKAIIIIIIIINNFGDFTLFAVISRMMTQHEFIVALHYMLKELKLFRNDQNESIHQKIKTTIPSLDRTVSIRPKPVEDERSATF